MFGAILKATNSSFQKGMAFYRSIYVKKVMKLLAFIFEPPSYKAFECISSTLQGKFNFQGLFKTVLYIQVLFKHVRTL